MCFDFDSLSQLIRLQILLIYVLSIWDKPFLAYLIRAYPYFWQQCPQPPNKFMYPRAGKPGGSSVNPKNGVNTYNETL